MKDEQFKTMSDEQRLEWAKTHWTVWKGLGDLARQYLASHEHVVGYMRYPASITDIGKCSFDDVLRVYRISPDYEPPKQAPKPKWLVSDIKELKSGSIVVDVPDGAYCSLDMLLRRAGYGGVQFKGQANDASWHMMPVGFISPAGNIHLADYGRDELDIAVPVRARFKV